MPSRSSFSIISRCGQGEGGNNNLGIFVVKYNRTNQKYIEKRVRVSAITRGDVQREIKHQGQCSNHPYIVGVFACDLDHHRVGYGSVYLQRAELGSLDSVIKRYAQHGARFPDEGFLWKVMFDMSLGLAYIMTGQDAKTARDYASNGRKIPMKHGWHSIIHRDMKPSNIFMTYYDPLDMNTTTFPNLMIGDFGCSKGASDRVDPPPNDVAFAPPEGTLRGNPEVDVFSLALSLICLYRRMQTPPRSDHLKGMGASDGLHMVLATSLQADPHKRPDPQQLPLIVCMGYREWRARQRRGFVPARLPSWAVPRPS
jgi:serine/threonine protein kinase